MGICNNLCFCLKFIYIYMKVTGANSDHDDHIDRRLASSIRMVTE